MKYYKVIKIMQYTEVFYVEAESEDEAVSNSEYLEGIQNHDDTWMDSSAKEITEYEYLEADK